MQFIHEESLLEEQPDKKLLCEVNYIQNKKENKKHVRLKFCEKKKCTHLVSLFGYRILSLSL